MSEQAKSSVGWTVWLWWVLASAGGGAVGFAAADALLDLMSAALYQAIAEVVIFGLIGAGLGTMQWLVLRNLFSQAGWWIVASTVGGAIIGIGAASLGGKVGVGVIIAYGLSGAILGILHMDSASPPNVPCVVVDIGQPSGVGDSCADSQVFRPNGAGYGTASAGNGGANNRIWFDGCCGWVRHRGSVGLDAAKTRLCAALILVR